ncbi:hypothetical protein [Amphibacillus cookii]|uniref:hypothetical protein n=1 Tax=Amphibacillus cookii TaxID=767787 RepID=UPI0019589700|nr:hypothetical protein [Amphibacillus cookii]MBM7541580.1 hypothetical protein [Amphibacillus cookii]
MGMNKEIVKRMVNFKSLLIQMILYGIGINLASSLFSPYKFDILIPISTIIGIGIAMPVIYFFLNKKSFEPMLLPMVSLVVILSLPFIVIIAIATYFGMEFVINIIV